MVPSEERDFVIEGLESVVITEGTETLRCICIVGVALFRERARSRFRAWAEVRPEEDGGAGDLNPVTFDGGGLVRLRARSLREIGDVVISSSSDHWR